MALMICLASFDFDLDMKIRFFNDSNLLKLNLHDSYDQHCFN